MDIRDITMHRAVHLAVAGRIPQGQCRGISCILRIRRALTNDARREANRREDGRVAGYTTVEPAPDRSAQITKRLTEALEDPKLPTDLADLCRSYLAGDA